MGGFDNGSLQGGIFFQAKQFGSILRGSGPPVPQSGVVGDLYIDVQSWFLYEKRSTNNSDPWGHYLFQVPATYRNQLKWFATSAPEDTVGVTGDYCLSWAGYRDYGLQPMIYGPKVATGWSENGNGPTTTLDPAYAGSIGQTGTQDETTATLSWSTSTQIIVAGLVVNDEYVLAIPTPNAAGTVVNQVGVQGLPASVAVVLNSLYTAQDEHAV